MSKIDNILTAALTLLGPNGEHWTRGCKDNDKYCIMTAIWEVGQNRVYRDDNAVAAAIIRLETIGGLSDLGIWNDAGNRKWEEVKDLFERGLGLAGVV